jgi:hypothetical protein
MELLVYQFTISGVFREGRYKVLQIECDNQVSLRLVSAPARRVCAKRSGLRSVGLETISCEQENRFPRLRGALDLTSETLLTVALTIVGWFATGRLVGEMPSLEPWRLSALCGLFDPTPLLYVKIQTHWTQ